MYDKDCHLSNANLLAFRNDPINKNRSLNKAWFVFKTMQSLETPDEWAHIAAKPAMPDPGQDMKAYNDWLYRGNNGAGVSEQGKRIENALLKVVRIGLQRSTTQTLAGIYDKLTVKGEHFEARNKALDDLRKDCAGPMLSEGVPHPSDMVGEWTAEF